MVIVSADEPLAHRMVSAIRSGDLAWLQTTLHGRPELSAARIPTGKGGARTPLHVATDWPGYFPHAPAVVRLLIDAGADPNAPIGDPPSETPLYWAASSDDVDVADSLIDGGADLEARGASIAGGPPLDNAVGYGYWHVARRLVERGARVDALWHAAALGMLTRIEALLARKPTPTTNDLNEAFWQACHGGQRRVAEYLLGLGADLNAMPDYTASTPLDIAGSLDTRREALTTWLRDHGARPTTR